MIARGQKERPQACAPADIHGEVAMTDDDAFLLLCEKVWGLSEERKLLSAQAAQARLTDDPDVLDDLADRIDLNRVEQRLSMARLLEAAQPELPDPGSAPVQAAPSRLALKSRSTSISGQWLAVWTVRPVTPSPRSMGQPKVRTEQG